MDFDPDGLRLPIKVDTTSNGEYIPHPLTSRQELANREALRFADEAAKRVGLKRRRFLISASGSAATLLAFNRVHAGAGGYFALSPDAAYDNTLAQAELGKKEFIFDIQTHCVDPSGKWATGRDGQLWKRNLLDIFGQSAKCEKGFECYSARQLLKEVYLDSDTDVSVVSALWGAEGHNPTPTDYAAEARAIIDEAQGRERCLIHGGVMPNEPGEIERMEEQAKVHKVSAWKLYPQWGPNGKGYFMDDPIGIQCLEKARALGIKTVAAHRGLPLPNLEYQYSHPADIARVAKRYPDMTFICYHAGFEREKPEGPYDPNKPAEKLTGVDRLIRAFEEQGFKPNQGNLYAELGSVWHAFMAQPDVAAHLMGKLLKHFGEDRICWGTDSIWYGSPQDQIETFRVFQITEQYQEKFGYPKFTDAMKAKIFGLNSARIYGLDAARYQQPPQKTDRIGALRASYADNPNPSYETFGPKTRREFFSMLNQTRGRPG